MYYVYLNSFYGTQLIGKGDYEKCKKIKAEKDREWKPGYMWSTEITDHELEEFSCFD